MSEVQKDSKKDYPPHIKAAAKIMAAVVLRAERKERERRKAEKARAN
jgi:hypothetical protein